MVIAHESAPSNNIKQLEQAGVEVLLFSNSTPQAAQPDLKQCLLELGRKEMTNILIEGGGSLLGSCFDARLIDEVHIFIAPKIVGGKAAITPARRPGTRYDPANSEHH